VVLGKYLSPKLFRELRHLDREANQHHQAALHDQPSLGAQGRGRPRAERRRGVPDRALTSRCEPCWLHSWWSRLEPALPLVTSKLADRGEVLANTGLGWAVQAGTCSFSAFRGIAWSPPGQHSSRPDQPNVSVRFVVSPLFTRTYRATNVEVTPQDPGSRDEESAGIRCIQQVEISGHRVSRQSCHRARSPARTRGLEAW